MRRSFLVGLIPAVAFAAVSLASTKEAHAGPYLGLDLDLGTAFQDKVDFSLGGGARFGYKFIIPRTNVWLLPEGGIHYMKFGLNSEALSNQPAGGAYFIDHAVTFTGGIRVGLAGIVQPNIFGHLGYGILGGPATNVYGGPVTDIGAGLDFKLSPVFTLGLQVAYNRVTAIDSGAGEAYYGSAQWVNFGINGGFDFGAPPPRRAYYYR